MAIEGAKGARGARGAPGGEITVAMEVKAGKEGREATD